MKDVLKLLRYNTGNDKKAFVEFKDDFDAVIFNASIVAYSGASIADIISVHMNRYIIDPQTYILQHDASAFLSNKGTIKASVMKYLEELPQLIRSIIAEQRRALTLNDISLVLDDLVDSVYGFQINYITKFLQGKDYNKYLEFFREEENATEGYAPKVIIAPYFRLKREYGDSEAKSWLYLNNQALTKFVAKYSNKGFPIAAQLLLDKKALCSLDAETICETYNVSGYEYIFIWVDDFSPLSSRPEEQRSFKQLLDVLNSIGKKPIMAYGGYDSILLCHEELSSRLYGVAQSVGYGESRNITPVGGGLPVNKYYFYPTHQRMTFGDVTSILSAQRFFVGDKAIAAQRFYEEVCDCPQCQAIIRNNIDNFNLYNDSVPYSWKGDIKRNRPTTEASFHAARHFMCCKKKEWETIESKSIHECVEQFAKDVEKSAPTESSRLARFIKTYVG